MENWSTVFSVYYTLNEKEITPHETGQPKTDVESLKKGAQLGRITNNGLLRRTKNFKNQLRSLVPPRNTIFQYIDFERYFENFDIDTFRVHLNLKLCYSLSILTHFIPLNQLLRMK